MLNALMLYLSPVILGGFHAFEPGHGKTLIAAYMIGTRGRAIDGVILGVIVTFTHTFSVIILGIIARLMAGSFTDEQLHGWFGLVSAALILVAGIWMLRQRLSGHGHNHFHLFGHGNDHGHNHGHDHGHDHESHNGHTHGDEHGHDHGPHNGHDHGHVHGTANHFHTHGALCERHNGTAGRATNGTTTAAESGGTPKFRQLLLLGISGGLVPCPAAIATLLAAIAAGRIAQALTMALLFSLGLGLVMIAIGVAVSQAGRLAIKVDTSSDLGRRLGIASAVIITILGAATLAHSIKTIWFS